MNVYVIDAFPGLGAFSLVAKQMGHRLLKVVDDRQDVLNLFAQNVPCDRATLGLITYDDDADDALLTATASAVRKIREVAGNVVHLHAAPYLDSKTQKRRLQILQRMLREWQPDTWDFVFNKKPKEPNMCQNMLSVDTAICGVPQSKRLYVCGRGFVLNTRAVTHVLPADVLCLGGRYMLRLPTRWTESAGRRSYCRSLSVPAYTVSPRSLKVYDSHTDAIVRSLSPSECAQLQGFHNYPQLALPCRSTHAYLLISSSIPPQVCECVLLGMAWK